MERLILDNGFLKVNGEKIDIEALKSRKDRKRLDSRDYPIL